MDFEEFRTPITEVVGPKLARLRSLAVTMLVAGLALSAIGLLTERNDPRSFFASYLYAWWFWLGVTTGSTGFLMLHHTVGGGWGYLLRRLLEAGSRLLLPMAVLFLPVVVGLLGFHLYEWATPEARHDHVLQAKAAWLNVPRWLAFAVLYFAIWGLFQNRLTRLGDTQDERADREIFARLNYWGGWGIVFYVLTMTVAGVDWIMSLEPHWFSSIFGLLTVASQGLGTLALMVWLMAYLAGDTPLLRHVRRGYFRDLGNLMLALVLLWAYLSFSQWLIIYSGNLTEEITWPVRRTSAGWQVIGAVLIGLHFFYPFLTLLIWSDLKRDPIRLGRFALVVLVMRFVDYFWWVTPAVRPELRVTAADVGMPLLLGGIWFLLWIRALRPQPVVPPHDPRFEAFVREMQAHPHGEVASHG